MTHTKMYLSISVIVSFILKSSGSWGRNNYERPSLEYCLIKMKIYISWKQNFKKIFTRCKEEWVNVYDVQEIVSQKHKISIYALIFDLKLKTYKLICMSSTCYLIVIFREKISTCNRTTMNNVYLFSVVCHRLQNSTKWFETSCDVQ